MCNYLFTSESVTEGHPDKLCDCVSDAILDALLEQDPHSRCACETTASPGELHIMGEITTAAQIDYEAVARNTVREIGYDKDAYGFNADSIKVRPSLHQQSPDIALGVERAQHRFPIILRLWELWCIQDEIVPQRGLGDHDFEHLR
ncbi:MAG TPA: S-adenosylmethionine synthetase N-terminal domain-containing protein [Clostridia bacterium]|nr:S-adenosylmethionine synthetase N-terminal domain-containing protein [Clostridia bacterium]